MIKKHKRTNSGWMRRSSRIYLNALNSSKSETLKVFLHKYSDALNYCIVRYWSTKDTKNTLADKSFTDSIVQRFGVTARIAQCVAKQSKEVVLSQRKKSKKQRTMPRFHRPVANLDSRFVSMESFNGSFDECLKFSSGVPSMIVPFNWTNHTNKFRDNGWKLSKSIRVGLNDNGIFIDFIFEKKAPPKRTVGKIIGIDRGFRSMLYTSDGQDIGTELCEKIKGSGYRRKSYHHYIDTEEHRCIKTLNLSNVRTIILEDLKYVKHNKRGTFSRQSNRLLSFWHYAKVGARLEQLCKEQGISIEYKNPWKTSQRCPECDNIDRKNRSGKKFCCLVCGFTDDADHVGARNLEALGLAGVYSLRSLKKHTI